LFKPNKKKFSFRRVESEEIGLVIIFSAKQSVTITINKMITSEKSD